MDPRWVVPILAASAVLFPVPLYPVPLYPVPPYPVPRPTTVASASAAPAAVARPCPIVSVARPHEPAPAPLPIRDATAPTVGGAGLATTGLAVPDGTPALPTDVSATSWVVADLDTGQVLGACAPHAYSAPASVQKLLLCATVMPKLKPTDITTITAEDLDFEPGSSAVGLVQGGQYTVETLWLGLLLNSGNDAANVLARLGSAGRGVPGTVADMNAEAKHLGALDTHAATPSGLDGPGQVTSAYDLALIARTDFARADFSRYTASRTAAMPPELGKPGYEIQNDNQLLFDYPGAIGGKTGFTDIAQHTYVGAASRNGRRLVVTMLNGEHEPVRMWQQGESLLDWGFAVPAGVAVGRLVEPGELGPNSATPSPDHTPGQPVAAVVTTHPRLGRAAVASVGVLVFAGLIAVMTLVRRRRRSR